MKTLKQALLVCVLALLPAAAHADDGGVLEWLEKWSGPKFWGVATDFHLCIDKENRVRNCERFFGVRKLADDFRFDDIRHEFDYRVAFYASYGDLFAGDPNPQATESDRHLFAWKLMPFYHYHFNRHVALGAGTGILLVHGHGMELLSRSIVTPASLVVAPTKGIWFVRVEESYIAQGLTAADLGSQIASYGNKGEWNFSVGIGIDFRRRQ
jgi:hypothetical protein